MNESAQSDTTSDSEFDEQELTAEEEDEDSIAPEEDVADEEEVDSLVKESQMSLEDLLASYGVPTSGLNINVPVGQTGSRSRASRAVVRRSAGAAASTVQSDTGATVAASDGGIKLSEDSRTSRSVSPTVKRSRRSNASPSPGPTHAIDCTQDTEHSKRKPSGSAIERANEVVKKMLVTTSDVNQLGDSAAKLPTTACFQTDNPVTVPSESSQRASRRRVNNMNSTVEKISPSAASQELNSVSSDVPTPSIPPSTVALTTVHDELTDKAVATSTPAITSANNLPSENNPIHTGEITATPSCELEGEESRDSVRDESYSSRFWQRAIGGDSESPPSYNSDDDEDYAPSVESGHDWRGEIHVGEEYQATVPPFHPHSSVAGEWWDTRRFELESSILWQPGKLPEQDVIRFERLFAQSVMFPLPSERTVDDEQALFTLMQCNYDPDEALQRLRFRTVSPGEIPGYMETWSEADATAFEKGFALYNKDFKQIRDTRLRHKTVTELVHYYYLWKKSARHDEFARAYRRDKRKSPHPSMTDFMDCLVLEQEAVAEAYMAHLNDSGVGSFHLVNRLSSGHHRAEFGSGAVHEPSCGSRYLSHPDPHMLAHQPTSVASADSNRTPEKPIFSNPYTDDAGKDKVLPVIPSGTTVLKTTDPAGHGVRTTSVSV